MVLENWFLNQEHQHHLSLLEGPTLDPSPDLLDQTLGADALHSVC